MKNFFPVFLVLFSFFFPSNLTAGIRLDYRWEKAGTLVVEGRHWEARFAKDENGMFLYKDEAGASQYIGIIPFDENNNYASKVNDLNVEILDGNKIVVETVFSVEGGGNLSGTFYFNEEGLASLSPGIRMEGIRLEGNIEYAVLPGIFLEDIIYDPGKAGGAAEFHIPSEELFAGLLGEGDGMLICAWPEGNQKVKILLEERGRGKAICGVELTLDGKDAYIGLLVHRGIWHLAEFQDDYKDRDIKTGWRKPFEAAWRTEVVAGRWQIKSAYLVRNAPERWWFMDMGWVERGPAWFCEKGEAVFHLPGGQLSLEEKRTFIYPLEGHPYSLMGFLESTPMEKSFHGIRKRSGGPYPRPRGVSDVGFTSCWGTGLIRRTLFEMGSQSREGEQEFLNDWMEYVADAAMGTLNRRSKTSEFLENLQGEITGWKNDGDCPGTAAFLREMHALSEDAIRSHNASIERLGKNSPEEYAEEISRLQDRLRTIIETPGTEFVPEYYSIVDRLNWITWGQQHHIGKWGWRLREWFQKAGELCGDKPGAVRYAEKIRKEIRVFLDFRNEETMDGRLR